MTRFIGYLLLAVLAGDCRSQDAVFSSDVKVVSLLATVRDSSGKVVGNLTKDDFQLEEDGRPQTIRYFSRESDLPLTIVLLVDTSRSMQTVFEPERAASIRFLEQVLREERDVAAVVHFDVKVETLQNFTSSREKLAAALSRLKIPSRISTLLYDGIRQSSENLMRKRSGRKAFILLSDGMDVRSRTSIGTAIEYAQRADTMIYSVLFTHPPPALLGTATARGPGRGPRVMRRLARETGGGFFEVSSDNPIDRIYAQIEDELRNQYSIGYTSDSDDNSGKYRKLKLATTPEGLVVRTRDGYYPRYPR
jgi:VWFA-related protein